MSWPVIRYVLTAALRDKLMIALAVLFILIMNLAVFSGSSAVVESSQFIVVFTGGALRLAGIVGLVLFVCFFIRRSFEAGDIELMLSRPLGRAQFISSYGSAFILMAIITALAEGAGLYSMIPASFGEAHILWVTSIAVENAIMIMVAFFFAMVLSNAVLCSMATLAFYVLARMIGQILGIVQGGDYFAGQQALGFIMKIIAIIVPRLDLMGQTSWLVYGLGGNGPGLSFVISQGIVFIILVFLAALIDLRRKQF